MKEKSPKPSIMQRLRKWWNGENYVPPTKAELREAREIERQSKEDAQEDSEGDGLMEFSEPIFPEEIED